MLFIYRVLPIGGIETFFVRMAKERARLGLTTSILLLSEPKDSNPELLAEMKKFYGVAITLPGTKKLIGNLFLNIYPINHYYFSLKVVGSFILNIKICLFIMQILLVWVSLIKKKWYLQVR